MDIILVLFGMSIMNDSIEAPKPPTAVVIPVAKLSFGSSQEEPDPMWDPNWINK